MLGEEKNKTPPGNSRTKIAWAILAHGTAWKNSLGENYGEQMKSLIFDLGKAEIGLGTTIFGISVKSYRGYRNSRPNPLLGGPFRGRLKISVPKMEYSSRAPCPIFQSEPLCKNCPACKKTKPPLGNFLKKRGAAILKKKCSIICFIF